MRGSGSVGKGAADRFVAVSSDAARAEQLYEDGLAAFRRGDEETRARLNDEALEIGRALGDPASIARGLIGLSRVAFRAGDHDRLRALCEEAEPFWLQLEDPMQVTSPVHMMAESYRLQGTLDRARELYERSIAIAHRHGDLRWVALELNNVALLELQAGDPDAAERATRRSLATVEPEPMELAYALLSLGSVAASRREGNEAARMLGAAHSIMQELESVFDPADQPLFDRAVALAREVTGDGFDAAWSAGMNLKMDEARALAR